MSRLDTLSARQPPMFVPELPPVISEVVADASNSILLESVSVDASKKTLVLCSKKLSEEDVDIFSEFGAVLKWVDKYVNVPLSQLQPFDYLIGDMNSKNFRLTLGRTDLSQYNIVSYVSFIQKTEDFIEQVPCNNILTSIPLHAVNKADFDSQLHNAKLVSPSMVKSLFQWVLGCLRK